MKTRGIAAALLMLAVAAGCGRATVSAAANGYGSGAVVMIHSKLRAGTPGTVAAALCQRLVAMNGVVFTNYVPPDELIVGLRARSAVRRVESFLHMQKAVRSVSQGPAPTAPPAPGRSKSG